MFHRGFKHSKTIKALGLRPRAFISFLGFETPMKHSHSFLKYYEAPSTRVFTGGCFYNSQSYESRVPLLFTCRPYESISIMLGSEVSLLLFSSVVRASTCFRGKLKNSCRYHIFKNKKIRGRFDSRVQFVWILRVRSC